MSERPTYELLLTWMGRALELAPETEPIAPNVIWNDGGVITLSVGIPPSISDQPDNASVFEGDTATFTLTATNATGYQWQKQESGAGAWTNISGATSASYTTGTLSVASDNTDAYRCVVTGAGGTTTSNTATLTVSAVVITGNAFPGEILTSTTARQWLRDGAAISGQTASTYEVLVTDIGTVISQANSNSVTIGGVSRYGVTSWANMSSFTVVGSTPTIVSNAIRISGAFGSWDTMRFMIQTLYNDRDFTFIVRFRCINRTDFGFAIGKLSGNGWFTATGCVTCRPDANGANSSQNSAYNTFSGTVSGERTGRTGSHPNLISVSDLVEWRFRSRNGVPQSTFKNLTTGSALTTSQWPVLEINSGRFGVSALGSTIDISSIQVIAHVPAAAQIVVIGDSKTAGSNMSYTSYADLIAATGRRVANFSGTGDRTVEAVQTKANYVTTGATHAIMCVGRNDLASGVSSGTWQANYASIVTDLKAAGMTVIHLVIPETVQSQTTLTSWITSTYPSDTKQYLASWVNATHLGADGIHPNLVGQQFIADTLVNSGVLPAP